MRTFALALVLTGGCGLPGGDVLTTKQPLPPWDACEVALDKARVGDPCVGISICGRKDGCCIDSLECVSGLISGRGRNCDACQKCADDEGCPTTQWCLSSRCEPCPAAKCTADCPAPFVHLNRHGCGTCDCGPPTSCEACQPTEKCAPGAYCQGGCVGAACCVSVCTAPGCAGPAPDGCATECGTQSCGTLCRAEACRCQSGAWVCTPRCATALEPWVSRCKVVP